MSGGSREISETRAVRVRPYEAVVFGQSFNQKTILDRGLELLTKLFRVNL